jgi:hypothetical protein
MIVAKYLKNDPNAILYQQGAGSARSSALFEDTFSETSSTLPPIRTEDQI